MNISHSSCDKHVTFAGPIMPYRCYGHSMVPLWGGQVIMGGGGGSNNQMMPLMMYLMLKDSTTTSGKMK